MVDGVSLLLTGIWSRAAQGRWSDVPGTNDIDTGAPFYDVYVTADGEYMAVGAIEPQFWARLLDGLALSFPDQWDRARWPEMKARIAGAFATRTRAEWTAVFADRDACVTPVLSLAEAPRDVHLAARGTLAPHPDGPQPAAAPRLGRTPLRAREAGDLAEALDRWELSVAGAR
jgi:alpha-methylacyl-CoA racemase